MPSSTDLPHRKQALGMNYNSHPEFCLTKHQFLVEIIHHDNSAVHTEHLFYSLPEKVRKSIHSVAIGRSHPSGKFFSPLLQLHFLYPPTTPNMFFYGTRTFLYNPCNFHTSSESRMFVRNLEKQSRADFFHVEVTLSPLERVQWHSCVYASH
jgi:hypothetical protein